MLPVRLLILFAGLLLGYLTGQSLTHYQTGDPQTGTLNTVSLMIAGLLLGLLLSRRLEDLAVRAGEYLNRWYTLLSPRSVTAATFALVVSLVLSVLLGVLLASVPYYRWWWNLLITLVLAGFFVPFAIRNSETFGNLVGTPVRRKNGGKILDSNVIIDGRIVELSRSGLLEGELIVPSFVLRELQQLSDHSDPQRRTRGKRGLNVLEELREVTPLRVEDWDTTDLTLTDDKLVRLARETGGKLVSNDGDLGKVARLYGVTVINLNEAAVALRPQLQVGDVLNVTITKNGQQAGQGIGYLEDGTMMVVEEGAKFKNRSVRVVVVNNVQTNVGRMIFARPDNGDPVSLVGE
ncbi:PIN/TRAM domain-containing protein [Deinococcus sp. KNUC1210]|uniref:PIN/TRAM domain-containing protein n=1 Tax=Deinococcus sp. KNUC1210 TaxID=2917691 RepID=UPI001EEFB425|nr:TRAM domain-containing protein [Deinococcus sp. KNUC1210]ULH15029.1 PIN/TRAM domain-containing protein [Deinococcus sp. KNUC1210]